MVADRDFQIYAKLVAFEKSGEDNPMRIGGIVSTDGMDQDDEKIIQEGLDFAPFLNRGWFNDNHSKETTGVVGYPTIASYMSKGSRLPNGDVAESNCWWAEGYLLNNNKGRDLWALIQSLENTPRNLGFSIEGKVKKRHPRRNNVVTRAVVHNVAVTHCPVNTGTELQALAKALTSGAAVPSGPGGTPGDGAPLRRESLDRNPVVDDDNDDDLFDDDTDEEDIDKAVDRDFQLEPISEYEYIESWADQMSAANTVTPEEARLIVKSAHPHLDDNQIDKIIRSAGA